MKKYVIDLVELYGIYVIPMHIIMDDVDYQDGSIPVTEVYEYYLRTKKIPKTSAANPHEYVTAFQKITAENPEAIIILISYSSQASSTYQNAHIASEGIENIHHIDSLNVSGGEAAIILKAVELLEKHPDIQTEDLIKKIESFVARARVSFIPGHLEYLKAGGRLSNAAYLGASLLQLKPLIEIVDGKLVATKKYRGAMKNIAEKYLPEYLDRYNLDKAQLCLLHSLGLEENIKLRMEQISQAKGFQTIVWIQTGCVITAHSGPGSVGIAGFEVS
ncbi:MAG: DegV family protein [Firmicutes bacterium]|nr:DegV family protein [Bacillota bacterium]